MSYDGFSPQHERSQGRKNNGFIAWHFSFSLSLPCSASISFLLTSNDMGNYDLSLMSRKCPSCLYLPIETLLQHGIVLEARSLLGIGQHLVLLKECPVLEKSISSTELTTCSAVSCFHNDSIDSSYLIFMPILLEEPGLWYTCDYFDWYLSCFTVISVIMALSARRPSAGALDPLEQPLHALSQMLAAYARHFVREIHRASTGKYCRF